MFLFRSDHLSCLCVCVYVRLFSLCRFDYLSLFYGLVVLVIYVDIESTSHYFFPREEERRQNSTLIILALKNSFIIGGWGGGGAFEPCFLVALLIGQKVFYYKLLIETLGIYHD